MAPKFQWTNANGTVVKVFASDKPHAFKVVIDNAPWDPMQLVEKATK